MTKKSRLSALFEDFANRNNFHVDLDEDNQEARFRIEFAENDKSVTVNFKFESSEDSYQYFAAIGQVTDPDEIATLSDRILKSEPIRGITERITPNGNFIVMGGKDDLGSVSEDAIRRGFQEDVHRIAETYQAYQERLAGDSTTDAPPEASGKRKEADDFMNDQVQPSVSLISSFLKAIKKHHPELTDSQIEEIGINTLRSLAQKIDAGYQLAAIKSNVDGILSLDVFQITEDGSLKADERTLRIEENFLSGESEFEEMKAEVARLSNSSHLETFIQVLNSFLEILAQEPAFQKLEPNRNLLFSKSTEIKEIRSTEELIKLIQILADPNFYPTTDREKHEKYVRLLLNYSVRQHRRIYEFIVDQLLPKDFARKHRYEIDFVIDYIFQELAGDATTNAPPPEKKKKTKGK